MFSLLLAFFCLSFSTHSPLSLLRPLWTFVSPSLFSPDIHESAFPRPVWLINRSWEHEVVLLLHGQKTVLPQILNKTINYACIFAYILEFIHAVSTDRANEGFFRLCCTHQTPNNEPSFDTKYNKRTNNTYLTEEKIEKGQSSIKISGMNKSFSV